MSLFQEFQRRNVFRVALLYAVASWLVIQVTDVGTSLLDLPGWTGRFVFLLLLIGFPLVLVFSWVYEITPEGLKKEADVQRNESVTAETAKKLNVAVIVLLVIAVGGLVTDRLVPESSQVPAAADASPAEPAAVVPPAPGAPSNSIAVLPFVNMSSDEENEYFSDGLSEELLNLLVKIPQLRVAARTSSFSFKGSDANVSEIAETLNVSHVLEGSVRKSGDDIRITAQLINASDGYHIWSETWDRQLDNVFAIQDEIAALVVDGLRLRLLDELPHTQVTDPRAYELLLRSRASSRQSTEESFTEAIELLEEALAIDPGYADAWAALSAVQTNQAGMGFTDTEAAYAKARESNERALEIDPTHGRALAGLAWDAMYTNWDFAEAHRLITRALDHEPGNTSALNAYATLLGAMGQHDRMIENYETALRLDPVSMSVLANLAGAYLNASRFDDMRRLINRIGELDAGSTWYRIYRGWLELVDGDVEAGLTIFRDLEGPIGAWGELICLYDLGRTDEFEAALEAMEAQPNNELIIATTHAYAGNADLGFEWLDRAYENHTDSLNELRMYRFLTEPIRNDPRWQRFLSKLGVSDEDAEAIGI